jgi:hypothetical protein
MALYALIHLDSGMIEFMEKEKNYQNLITKNKNISLEKWLVLNQWCSEDKVVKIENKRGSKV